MNQIYCLEKVIKSALFLFWPVIVFIPFSTPVWLGIFTFLAMWHFLQSKQKLIFPSSFETILVGFALLWGLVSALWSVDAGRSINVGLSLCGLSIMGLVFITYMRSIPATTLQSFLPAFINGSILAFLLLIFEIFSNGWLLSHFKPNFEMEECYKVYEFHKPAVILTTIFWLLMAVFIHQRRYVFMLAIASGFAAVQFFLESDAVSGALALGSISFCVARIAPRLFFKVLTIGMGITALAAPLLSLYILTPQNFEQAFPNIHDGTYYHRLYMWNYVAKKAFEEPLIGHGLDASRHAHFKEVVTWDQPYKDKKTGEKIRREYRAYTISMHPHNIFFQWWFELGMVGAVMWTALLVGIIHRLRKLVLDTSNRWVQACYGALLPSIILIAGVSYGIWQNWWFSTLVIAYAMTIFVHRGLTPSKK
jgi:O-antigen ligase